MPSVSPLLKGPPGVTRASSKHKRVSPGQQQLPWDWYVRLSQIAEDWHQLAMKFRRANGIRCSRYNQQLGTRPYQHQAMWCLQLCEQL